MPGQGRRVRSESRSLRDMGRGMRSTTSDMIAPSLTIPVPIDVDLNVLPVLFLELLGLPSGHGLERWGELDGEMLIALQQLQQSPAQGVADGIGGNMGGEPDQHLLDVRIVTDLEIGNGDVQEATVSTNASNPSPVMATVGTMGTFKVDLSFSMSILNLFFATSIWFRTSTVL